MCSLNHSTGFAGETPEPTHTSKTTKNPWSDLRIIDVHAHIGQFKGYDLSWTTLQENLKRRGISRVLISNIDGADLSATTRNLDEKKANEATARLVADVPNASGLAWARPVDGASENLVPFLKLHRKDSKENLFVGIKLHPEMNHFAADDTRVDPYMALCRRFNIPAVVHCGDGSSSAMRIYALARRHPTVPVVLYHMGFGTNHQESIATVKAALKAKDANLYLETAQADPKQVLSAVKQIGSERVLFGTDATYFGKKHYENYDELVALLRAKLTKEELDDVLYKNAQRLFHL